MLKNTLQTNFEIFLSKNTLTMNANPKLFITNIFLYLNKRSNHKNDDPQQLNIVI